MEIAQKIKREIGHHEQKPSSRAQRKPKKDNGFGKRYPKYYVHSVLDCPES